MQTTQETEKEVASLSEHKRRLEDTNKRLKEELDGKNKLLKSSEEVRIE